MAEGGGWRPVGLPRLGRWDVSTFGLSRGDLWIMDDALVASRWGRRRRERVFLRSDVVRVVVRMGMRHPWPSLRVEHLDGTGTRFWSGRYPDLAATLRDAGWPVDADTPIVGPPVATMEHEVVRGDRRGDVRGWLWISSDALRVDLRTRRGLVERVGVEWEVARGAVAAITVEASGRRSLVQVVGEGGSVLGSAVAVRPDVLAAKLSAWGWPVTGAHRPWSG